MASAYNVLRRLKVFLSVPPVLSTSYVHPLCCCGGVMFRHDISVLPRQYHGLFREPHVLLRNFNDSCTYHEIAGLFSHIMWSRSNVQYNVLPAYDEKVVFGSFACCAVALLSVLYLFSRVPQLSPLPPPLYPSRPSPSRRLRPPALPSSLPFSPLPFPPLAPTLSTMKERVQSM